MSNRKNLRAITMGLALMLGFALVASVLSTPAGARPVTTSHSPAYASDLDLDAATIPELQQRMEAGELTALELTLAYLRRIRTVDDEVNAVLDVNYRAIAEAAASDRQRRRDGARSPMEGIPVLLKDNINTERQPATAGSRALLRARAEQDAELVRRLRDAGAIILGKTNLSEWANFRSTNSTSGWSAVGGQTNNPYVLDRNPCGSSSGSAAAAAASLAQVAIGTETNGSIVCPAAANGVVGVKPTLGLVSRTGVVPLSPEQDTAGPMSRHVIDSAITLAVMAGFDAADPVTADIPAELARQLADLLDDPTLDADALRDKRIGVWRLETNSPETDAVTEQAVEALQAAGATTVDVDLPYQDVIGANAYPALLAEFKHAINTYLANTPGRHPETLAELIEFNEQDPIELEFFGQEIFLAAQDAPSIDDPAYLAQREAATSAARASIDETLAAHQLDAIVAPTNSPAWLTTLGEGDAFLFGSSSPAAVAGYPNVTVPAGYVGELPVGLSIFGARWDDVAILNMAYSFEQATQVRREPRYLPTID